LSPAEPVLSLRTALASEKCEKTHILSELRLGRAASTLAGSIRDLNLQDAGYLMQGGLYLRDLSCWLIGIADG